MYIIVIFVGAVMLFHHMLSIGGFLVTLFRGINGTEVMATLFGTEITNPVLQMRWFIRYDGGATNHPILLGFVDMLFLGLFTLMRIIFGSSLLYSYLLHPRPDIIARTFAICLYGVSWIFWLLIVRYSFRKYILGFILRRPRNKENKGAKDIVTSSHSS